MTEISVGKSVGTDLKPYDDDMEFKDRPDPRVMDIIIDSQSRDEQAKCCIDRVSHGDITPGRAESSLIPLFFLRRISPFPPANCAFRLSCCCKFNCIGYEKVARYQRIENTTEDEVLFSVIVASNTYQDAVLRRRSVRPKFEAGELDYLHEILDNQS